jgi:transcriptional regulator with XRE-family HTH domain
MKKSSSPIRGEITLKALRKEAGKTQRQLATDLDVDQRTVSEWENGAIPAFDKAIGIAICLKISLKQLADALGFDVASLPDDSQTDQSA